MYKIIKSDTTCDYSVIEIATEHVMYTGRVESYARELCRSLNLGNGFNGFTPAFVVERFLAN